MNTFFHLLLMRVLLVGGTLTIFAFTAYLCRDAWDHAILVTLWLAFVWLFIGFAWRILIQFLIPMLQTDGPFSFFSECLLWPITLWLALRIM